MTDFIEIIDNALPDNLCDELITTFHTHQDKTFQGRTGGGVALEKKNSRDISISTNVEFKDQLQQVLNVTTTHVIEYFDKYYFALIGPLGMKVRHPETGEPTDVTQENYEQLVKPQISNFVRSFFRLGDINMQRYEAGQGGYPYWHSEVYPQLQHNDALHRIMLFMFYLNDVEQGGETEFYYQDKKIAPKKGTMVIAPAYFTHTHRGNIPISDNKYILTSWVLFNRAEQLYRG